MREVTGGRNTDDTDEQGGGEGEGDGKRDVRMG